MKFRALEPHEIEVRVSRCTKGGAFFLLYKDARCDQSILDETVGEMGWQRRHDEHKGNLFCSVGIRNDATGEWVWKEDAGSESNTEAEKGHASDSFKRACFNWGIGRELYTKIHIFVKGITQESERKGPGGRATYELVDPFMKYHVSEIETDNEEKKIRHLKIADSKGTTVFEWGDNSKPVTPKYIDEVHQTVILNELHRTGWNAKAMLEYLAEKFPKDPPAAIGKITEKQFTFIIKALEKKPDATAV